MDTLHTVLRSIREPRTRRDHLDIFREFLGHLDRIGRSTEVRPRAPAARRPKVSARRKGK
jgi:hypothetical protein